MPSQQLNVISHCGKSPWFSRTWSENAFYGEYADRLSLLSLGNDRVEEYWKLRTSVGLFDVPERPVEIKGPDALRFLNRVFTRSVDKLRVGRGSYGLLCHQDGGLVCDGILFKLAEDHFWYVHADADVYLWLVAHAHDYQVKIRDPRSWVLQVQGPKSLQVLANACDGGAPDEFRYFDAFQGHMGGQKVLVSRTGWSAELGFEVYNMDADVDGPALWDHLIAAGSDFEMTGCSQLSMNIRRIEGGILNYRTDMDWYTTPYDMGLGQFVDLDSHEFIGRDALRSANRAPRFSGFKCEDRQLRYGAAVMSDGKSVGKVTAYEISPYLKCGVGFVLFDSAESMSQSGFTVSERDGNACPVERIDLPFYDADKKLPRGLVSTDGFIA